MFEGIQQMKIQVGIAKLHEETYLAIALIDKILVKNNINRNVKISYDFMTESAGYHYIAHTIDTIYINPDNCKSLKTYDIDDGGKENLHYPAYTLDNTIFGTVLHEFSHLLHCQIFKTMSNDYLKEFPNKRLFLNWYSNNEIDDELANIMVLYITNPYLLKLISNQHFKYMKRYFKSPVSATKYRCGELYKRFPIHIKNDLKNRWGIIYNFDTNDFEKHKVKTEIKERTEV